MYWHIIKTEPSKENYVARALERKGVRIYLPMEYFSQTISRRTRRVRMIGKPAIPRVVFFWGLIDFDHHEILHSRGLAMTGGTIWQVTDPQMRNFMESLADAYFADGKWLPMTKEQLKAYKKRKREQNRARSLADLIKFKDELFGIDEREAA